MKLHNYLEDVFGSKVKVKILRELIRHPSKNYTMRELAQSIKVTHTGTRKALISIKAMNLVKAESHGPSHLLTINSRSSVFELLRKLYNDESKKFSELSKELTFGLPKSVLSIAIFGSFASETEKNDSDIDVMLITDNSKEAMDFIGKKAKKVIEKYGNVIVPYIMAKEEFSSKKENDFVKNVLNNHKLLAGENLWKLIR